MIRQIVASLLATIVIAESRPKKPDALQKTFMKPIFVVEFLNNASTESEDLLS